MKYLVVTFIALATACGGTTKYSADETLVSKTDCETRYEDGAVIMDCNGSVVNLTDMVAKEMIKMFGSVENMRGPQGPRGDTGQNGRDGTSIQGAPGRDGIDGLNGDRGGVGLQGTRGDTGFVGPQGPIGQTGARGQVGTSCWDLNNNGVFDSATEDTDRDGSQSVRDCVIEYDSSDSLPLVNFPFHYRGSPITIQTLDLSNLVCPSGEVVVLWEALLVVSNDGFCRYVRIDGGLAASDTSSSEKVSLTSRASIHGIPGNNQIAIDISSDVFNVSGIVQKFKASAHCVN
jgi:hypothetical protein